MGNKWTEHAKKQNLVFLSAGGSTDQDKLKHFFDSKDFGESQEERYNYFDDLVNENEELQ